MAIKIYSEFEEFNYEEKQICEFLQDDNFSESNYGDDLWEDPSDDFGSLSSGKEKLNEDANYFIICDQEDEEIAEDIASYLGKHTKIFIEDFHKIFFCVL